MNVIWSFAKMPIILQYFCRFIAAFEMTDNSFMKIEPPSSLFIEKSLYPTLSRPSFLNVWNGEFIYWSLLFVFDFRLDPIFRIIFFQYSYFFSFNINHHFLSNISIFMIIFFQYLWSFCLKKNIDLRTQIHSKVNDA